MRMPLAAKISARSGTSARGARTFNVVSDGRNGEVRKRPALVYSNGYGGLGNGLMETPNGLFSVWDGGAIVDEVDCTHLLGGGAFVAPDITGYTDVYISGMSDDGTVCCGWGTRTADSKTRALSITTTGVTELAYPSGITGSTWAYGISGDGLTIVGSGKPSSVGQRSYKWVGGVVTQIASSNINDLTIDGGAMAASSDGRTIVGWHNQSSVQKGYVHDSATGVTTYKTLPSPYSAATAVKFFCVSPDGTWIGGTAAEYPVLFNHSTGELRDIAHGTYGFVTGVSDQGEYACGFYSLVFDTSFLYRLAGSVLTDFTIGSRTTALAISRYGNSITCMVSTAGNDLYWYRWNQCGGTFKNTNNLGRVGVGTGESANRNFPKGGACSAMGTHVGITQFDATGSYRIPKIWVPA